MELNINSPAYFTKHYGVDDDVYKYCRGLHDYFKTKEYSKILSIIGITPVIAPQAVYDQGLWKEKIEQIQQMLLKVIKKVKSKGKFDWERFREDLLNYKGN